MVEPLAHHSSRCSFIVCHMIVGMDSANQQPRMPCSIPQYSPFTGVPYGILNGPVIHTGPLSTPYTGEGNYRKTTSRSAAEHNKLFNKSVTHTQLAQLHTKKEAPQTPYYIITGEKKEAEKHKAHILLLLEEMDDFIPDQDVGGFDALFDVPDIDINSLLADHAETEQEVQRHSRLIDDVVAEAAVKPADVRQFELSSTVRFRIAGSDQVF